MTSTAPIVFEWTDEGAMKPLARFAKAADAEFCVGEHYRMEAQEARSAVTHKHQFAWIHDAWLNLPEGCQHEPWAQSSEHLRKYALIRTGFCNTQTFACGTRAEAIRWAQNIRPMDEYSIVTVEGSTVYRFTAVSQSQKAMGAKDFQASKAAILEYIAGLLGVAPQSLLNARAA